MKSKKKNKDSKRIRKLNYKLRKSGFYKFSKLTKKPENLISVSEFITKHLKL